MGVMLLAVDGGDEGDVGEERVLHHFLQESDGGELRRGDDVTVRGGNQSQIRRQFYLAEERDGAGWKKIRNVNIESQNGNEVGKTHPRIHRTEGYQRLAMAGVTFASWQRHF